MQFTLTKKDLKLIAKLAREKRKRLFQFKDLYYGHTAETKEKQRESIEQIDVLIAKLLLAVKTRNQRMQKA